MIFEIKDSLVFFEIEVYYSRHGFQYGFGNGCGNIDGSGTSLGNGITYFMEDCGVDLDSVNSDGHGYYDGRG